MDVTNINGEGRVLNRKSEFRGKRLNNREWIYGDLIHSVDGIVEIGIAFSDQLGKRYMRFEVDPSTVGQFTGLKDKNGVEIFEGDVVKREFCHYQNSFDPVSLGFVDSEIQGEGFWIGVIKYFPSCGFVMNKVTEIDECNESKERVSRKPVVQYKTEIIGNIHDNPEIMESGVQA